jgi:hypothetical protein
MIGNCSFVVIAQIFYFVIACYYLQPNTKITSSVHSFVTGLWEHIILSQTPGCHWGEFGDDSFPEYSALLFS